MRGPKFTLWGAAPSHAQIYTRGRFAPPRPLAEKLSRREEYLTLPIYTCVKFQVSRYNILRDTKGSQIYTKGRFAPRTPPSRKKLLYPRSVIDPFYVCVKFQLSSSNTFRDMRGSQILRWGVKFSLKLVPYFGVKVHALIGIDRGGSLIVCDGSDCRSEVLLQSYSPSNVKLGLRNADF